MTDGEYVVHYIPGQGGNGWCVLYVGPMAGDRRVVTKHLPTKERAADIAGALQELKEDR